MTTAWDLFHELDRLSEEMDRAFTGSGRWTFPYSRVSFLPARAARAYPLVNVSEDKDSFYVDAMAPGVDLDSLDLSVTGSQLSIAGEKRGMAGDVKPEACHRNERAAGRFVRTVELPADVDSEKIVASYKDGILHVDLPKSESAKPRQIAVSVN